MEEHQNMLIRDGAQRIVFVSSPLAAETEWQRHLHVEHAKKACAFVVEKGCIPFAPHLLFPTFMTDDNPLERERAIQMGLEMISRCDGLWVFPYEDRISLGMAREIMRASALGKRIALWSLELLDAEEQLVDVVEEKEEQKEAAS